MSNLLTPEELKELTGATQPARQKRVLDDHGIYYIQKLDKTIITTWHHVNHPTGRGLSNDADAREAANACHGGVPLMDHLDARFHMYMLDKSQILNNAAEYIFPSNSIPSVPACYFLLKDSEIIYVGKTFNLNSRLRAHFMQGEKDFDSFSYIGTPCEHVAEYVEGFYMQAFRPPLNKYRPAVCEVTDRYLSIYGGVE